MRRRQLTLDDFITRNDGPALTPGDLSRVVQHSLSVDKIRDDIEANRLEAAQIWASTRFRYMIPFVAAKRYLLDRGFLRRPAHACST